MPKRITTSWDDLPESKNETREYIQTRKKTQTSAKKQNAEAVKNQGWADMPGTLKEIEVQKQKQYEALQQQKSQIVPSATRNMDAELAGYYRNLTAYGDYWGSKTDYDEGFKEYKAALDRLSSQYDSTVNRNAQLDRMRDDFPLQSLFLSGTKKAEKKMAEQEKRFVRDTALYNRMAQDANKAGDRDMYNRAYAAYQNSQTRYNDTYKALQSEYYKALQTENPLQYYYQTMTKEELEKEFAPFQELDALQERENKKSGYYGELENPNVSDLDARKLRTEQQDIRIRNRQLELDKQLAGKNRAAIEQALKIKKAEANQAKYEEIKSVFLDNAPQSAKQTETAMEDLDYFETNPLTEEAQALASKGKAMYEKDEETRKANLSMDKLALESAHNSRGLAKTNDEKGPEEGYIKDWQRDIFYALYSRDKDIAYEWLQLAQEQAETEHFGNIRSDASKGLSRVPGLFLAAGASLLGGLDPFTEWGQDLSKYAEAVTAGGAQALTEKGILNTGLGSGTLDEDVPILGGKGLGDLYQLAESMVQSGAIAAGSAYAGRYDQTLASVVSFLGTAMMGGSAAASDYRESISRGLTKEQAMRHATAAGIAEAAFEYISLDKLINMDISKGFWKNVFTQGGIEASEELCTTLANRINDGLLARAEGYDTQIEHRVKELVALGESLEAAKKKAEQEWIVDLINDGLGGFISGGLMSAGNTFVQWDAYKNTMEQFGSDVSAAERAALQAYAADNGIDIAPMAQASEITERTDSSPEPQNDNGPESQQIATGDETNQTEKNKKSTRETRSEKKTNRKQGEALTRVVDSIEQKVLDAGLENAERVYSSMVARYGDNISRAAESAVVRVAAREFSAAYETSNEAAEKAYKAAMQTTNEKPVQKAIQEAWKGASAEAAMLGNEKALQTVISGSGTGGALNLNAEIATKDGGKQQVQIAALGAEKGKVRLNNGEVVELDALQGLDADTKDVIQRLDAFDLGAARSLAFQEYRLATEKGEVTDGVRWVMNYALAYDQGRTGAISLQEAIRRSSLPAETVTNAYTQGQEATEKWRQDKENENAKKRKNAEKGETGRNGILDSSRVSQEKMDRLSADKKDALETFALLAEATGVDIRLIAQKSDQKGNVKGYQGLYNKEGNYIEIDINAGLNNIFKDLHTGMTAVLGHELTHWMQENAPTEYLAYKKAVLQAIMSTKNGQLRLERMIEAQINQNKREGKEITRSEAEDEVVADASMKRMGDTEFWDAVADNLGEKKADVAARIRDYISKFFQRVRELLRKASHTSEAARIVDQAEADVQANLRKLYAELTGAAIRNSAQTGTETKNAATEGGKQSDEKLSTRSDADYLDAVERGDMETAQKMVDEAAKRAGYTIDAYHGTNSSFTVFDPDRIGSNFHASYGGFYFRSTNNVKYYGDNTVHAFLKMENPMVLQAADDFYNAEDYYDASPLDRYYSAKSNKNDGIIVKHKKGNLYVVFDSAQIKSADPVTYDDSGKVIPLSERFNPEKEDIRYSTRDYSNLSDLDLLLNAANEISEGGGEDYWASLLESNPGLASEAEEIKRLGKQLRDTEAKLEEARRNLTLTDRKLRTRGISTLAATIMQNQKAGDINKKDVQKRITSVLTEAYQKALDRLDAGADVGTAWDTVYNEGVVKAADILLTDATYAEKLGYKWYTKTLGEYLGEGAREYVEADIASRVAQDFDANRYRPRQQGTVADRLVAQAENRVNKKLDAAKAENATLKAENVKLTEDKDFYKKKAETAKATAGDLYQQLLDKREELKNNKKLSADERKDTLKRLDNLERQMKAKRREAEVWKGKAEIGWKAANQAIRERDAAVEKLEKQLQRERDILSGKLKPPAIQSMLKAAREREAERVTQHKDEVFARYKERKSETALRGRIKNLHDEINRNLLKPREGHFVPQNLMRPVVELLDMVNTQTKRTKSESAQAKIDAINAAYDRIKNDERYSQYYDETVKEMLTELSATLEGRSIYELNYAELEDVYTVMKAMRTTIRNSIKADLIEKGKEVWEIGNALRQELRAGKGANPLLLEKYHMAMLSAERAFHRFGGYMPDSAWDKTYRMLDNAQLKMLTLEMQATRLFDSVLLEKADFEKAEALTSYDKKDLVDVGLKEEDGNAVPITRGMMLSLYMHLQNEENTRHLMYGGLTLPDFRRYYKGQENAWGKGSVSIPALGARVANLNELLDTVGEAGVATQYEAEQQAMREMWESVRGAIEDQLGEYDKKWIEASKEFFDNFSRRELNRVTNEMYGFSKAKVDNYFPIATDKNFLKTDFDSISRDISLENMGFMKERVKAGNPILLEDITKAVNRQISNVARYAGLTQALKTFNNVYNVQTKGYTDSVKKAMAQTFGDTGKNYIENLITDMIGGRTQPGTIFDRIKSNYAQAVLSANLSVTIKQAASFPTAAATVGWKPLLKALAKGGKDGRIISRANRALIDVYSPLLWKRAQGAIDTEIGDMAHAQDWTKKAKWLMGWIEKADIATVGRLWYAAEYYVKDNFDLPKGSDAQIKNGESPFYQKVAEVFNQIVEDTQPNYTVLQRPDILRNPNKLVRAMTMFSTQRFQNANILLDAAGEYNAMRRYNKQSNTAESKAALKSSKQKLTRAISSQVVSAVVLNVMTLAAAAILHRMNPWRDDDNELTVESVLEETLNGFLSTMAGSFLAGSELYEAISSMLTGSKYYGNDVGGISTINDFATAVVQFGQQAVKLIGDEDSKPEDWTKLAEKQLAKVGQYLAQMTGIPVANVNKIIAGGKNHIIDAVNGKFGSFEAGVERSNAVNARRLIKALEAGDEAKADAVMEEMRWNILKDKPNLKSDKVNAKIQSAVQSYVKQQYLDDEMSEEKAIHYMVEYGSADDENDAFWKIREWEAREVLDGEADDFSFSKYTTLREIIDNVGDISEEMQYLQDHGVKFEDANKEIKSYIGKQLKAGEYDEDEAIKTLQAYHKVKDERTKQYRPDTDDEAWFTVQEWKASAEHADDKDYSWNKYEDLFAAMDKDGDIEPHADELESHGIKSDSIKNAIVDHVKERYDSGEINASEAMQLLQKYRGMDANEAYWKVDEWDAKEAAYNAGEEFTDSDYRDLYAAIDANKDASAAVLELTEHGYKERNVYSAAKDHLVKRFEEGKINQTQFENQLSRYAKIVKNSEVSEIVTNAKCYKETGYRLGTLNESYLDGKITAEKYKQIRVKYGGKTADEAKKQVRWLDLKKSHPSLDISESAANAWYDGTAKTRENGHKSAKSAGMSIEAYLRAREVLDKIKDSNGNNTGEDEVIAALAKMNLTPQQKDALYYERYKGTTKYSKKKW